MAVENKVFGGRVRELRERMELTQRELADKINKTQGSVRNYESGKVPPEDTIGRLARALGTTSPGLFIQGDTKVIWDSLNRRDAAWADFYQCPERHRFESWVVVELERMNFPPHVPASKESFIAVGLALQKLPRIDQNEDA